jgi:hypothetical protein
MQGGSGQIAGTHTELTGARVFEVVPNPEITAINGFGTTTATAKATHTT